MLKDGLMFKTPNTAMAGIIETPPRHTHGTDRHGRVMAGASCAQVTFTLLQIVHCVLGAELRV
jgi:hypothetical protein